MFDALKRVYLLSSLLKTAKAEKTRSGAGPKRTLTSDCVWRRWGVDLRVFLSFFIISGTCTRTRTRRGNEDDTREDISAVVLSPDLTGSAGFKRNLNWCGLKSCRCVYSAADMAKMDGTNRSWSRCSAAPRPRRRCRWWSVPCSRSPVLDVLCWRFWMRLPSCKHTRATITSF